jgi:hypothetical protein
MTSVECVREAEVLDALFAGRLHPDRLAVGRAVETEEIEAHVAGCSVCRDVVTVATVFREDRRQALAGVQVPPAGQIWWRAAIRARLEATQAVERPLTWAHGVAAACAAGLTAGAARIAWPTVERGLGWLGDGWSLGPAVAPVAELTAAVAQRTVPFTILAVCVVLAPVALYLALAEDDR